MFWQLNRTYIKLRAYAKLNYLKEVFFDIETVFTLNWIVIYNCLNSLK